MNSLEIEITQALRDDTMSEERKVKYIFESAQDYFQPRDAEMWDS